MATGFGERNRYLWPFATLGRPRRKRIGKAKRHVSGRKAVLVVEFFEMNIDCTPVPAELIFNQDMARVFHGAPGRGAVVIQAPPRRARALRARQSERFPHHRTISGVAQGLANG